MFKTVRLLAASVLAPLLLAVACAGVPGPVYTGPDAPPLLDVDNFAPAEPGVALSARPDIAALQDAAAAGYRTVVNLQTVKEGAGNQAVYVEAVGLRHVHIPVAGPKVTADTADGLAAVLNDPSAHPVLVHCASGQRASGAYALFLHRHRGMPLADALTRGEQLGLSKSAVIEAVEAAAR